MGQPHSVGAPAGGALLKGFVENVVYDSIKKYLEPQNNNDKDLKNNLKKNAINLILSNSEFRGRLTASLALAENLLEETARGFEQVYDIIVDMKFYLVDKGLTGVSSGLFQAVFEVGLEIDPILGLPVYRGSSIRGALRSFFEDLVGPNSELVKVLFGDSGGNRGIGLLEVSDSLPIGCVNSGGVDGCLVYIGDVIAPHYAKPGEGIVEAEYEANPVPIQYMAIAPGTVFRIIIGIRDPLELANDPETRRGLENDIDGLLRTARSKGLLPQGIPDSSLQGNRSYYLGVLVARLLVEALQQGFAAKASKGYNVLVLPPANAKVMKSIVRVARPRQQRKVVQQQKSGPKGKGKPPRRGYRGGYSGYGRRGRRYGL